VLVLAAACSAPAPDAGSAPELPPPPGPAGDGEFRPEDPRWKRIFVAESADGLRWTPRPEPLATTASSPQLVRIDGDLRVYFVHHGRALAWVPWDGGQARSVGVEGLEGGLQVDPCIVGLPDGGARLYLVHHPAAADPGLAGRNRVLSARLEGDRWSLEDGVRHQGDQVDPDIVPLPDGGWRMFLTRSPREVVSARSDDGLSYTMEDGLRFDAGGVTSTHFDGQGWWMFFHESGTLGRAYSQDGARFERPERLILEGHQEGAWMLESPAVLRDGERWLMVYAMAPTREDQIDW